MNNCDMRTLLLLFITLMLTSCAARKAVSGVASQENIIILYEPDAGNKDLIKEAEKYGSKILYVYKNINGIAVTDLRVRRLTMPLSTSRALRESCP